MKRIFLVINLLAIIGLQANPDKAQQKQNKGTVTIKFENKEYIERYGNTHTDSVHSLSLKYSNLLYLVEKGNSFIYQGDRNYTKAIIDQEEDGLKKLIALAEKTLDMKGRRVVDTETCKIVRTPAYLNHKFLLSIQKRQEEEKTVRKDSGNCSE